MMNAILCLYYGHEPRRHPLGGFRCARCSRAAASLDELGFPGQGYISPTSMSRIHGFEPHP